MMADEGVQDPKYAVVKISGADLLALLERCERGETADAVFSDLWTTAEHVASFAELDWRGVFRGCGDTAA